MYHELDVMIDLPFPSAKRDVLHNDLPVGLHDYDDTTHVFMGRKLKVILAEGFQDQYMIHDTMTSKF